MSGTPTPDELRQLFLALQDQWATEVWPGDGEVGIPYIFGGKDPRFGLDCSGCQTAAGVQLGIWREGFQLDNDAAMLYQQLEPVELAAELQPGDLVFYGPNGTVDHVMCWVGDGRVLGASGAGSSCRTAAAARAAKACVHYEPSVDYRRDFIGYRALPVEAS